MFVYLFDLFEVSNFQGGQRWLSKCKDSETTEELLIQLQRSNKINNNAEMKVAMKRSKGLKMEEKARNGKKENAAKLTRQKNIPDINHQ